MTPDLEAKVLAHLHSERFLDRSVRQVYAALLDEEIYLCSWRSMYRLLGVHQEVRERRNLRRHPVYTKPELAADGPNQVWTWDITYLKAEIRGKFYYLYVIVDLFSRYVVGWMLADRECAELARRLLEQTCRKWGIAPSTLTVHSDRGAPMKSRSVKQLYILLGVTPSYSRPRVSNDNPFSESGFKTMKYSPDFPERFGSQAEAEIFCKAYFNNYNNAHYHTGIALLTPAQVYRGEAKVILAKRQETLDAAFAEDPKRFGNRRPKVTSLPKIVWINRPAEQISKSGIAEPAKAA